MYSVAKRGLVLVRLGTDHRISEWLTIPKQQRNWDLALSLYENVDLGVNVNVDFLHYCQGGKWDGIHNFFSTNSRLLSAYDYFWLVDDDIEASPQNVTALFDYVRTHHFELAQPALTLDSYCSYRLTLQCPDFSHRNSNFVELMAPVLANHMLERALPLFAGTLSGWGIDWYWHHLASRPHDGIAIVDAIPVGHRRPIGQHLRGKMRDLGVNPFSERKQLAKKLNRYIWLYPVAFRGMLKDGSSVSSNIKTAYLMIKSYWSTRKRITASKWTIPGFLLFCVLQVSFQRVFKK